MWACEERVRGEVGGRKRLGGTVTKVRAGGAGIERRCRLEDARHTVRYNGSEVWL